MIKLSKIVEKGGLTMKILIVDDRADTKCACIIEECRRRNIEIEIARASKEAIFMIFSDEGETIDGIILDINMPMYPYCIVKLREGENLLKSLSNRKINIPVLIFSDEDIEGEYDQVFEHIKDWYKEKNKFFDFLEKLPEERQKREELEKLKKQKEEQQKAKQKKGKRRKTRRRNN